MLIHSVTPIHLLTEQPEIPALEQKLVAGGYVEGSQTRQGFVLSRLCSTNPADYLDGGFAPGQVLKG